MAKYATVGSRAIWPWFVAAQGLGHDPKLELTRIGLSEGQLRDPGQRIPYATAMTLVERLVRFTGRPDLGLVAARAVEPGHFELLELVVRSADTLGRAVDRLVQFFQILDGGGALTLERGTLRSSMGYVVTCGLQAHPAYVEFISAMLLLAARRETGVEDLGVESVRFQHDGPDNVADYIALYGGPVRFGAPQTLAVFATEALSLPLQRANAATHSGAVAAICDWFLKTGT